MTTTQTSVKEEINRRQVNSNFLDYIDDEWKSPEKPAEFTVSDITYAANFDKTAWFEFYLPADRELKRLFDSRQIHALRKPVPDPEISASLSDITLDLFMNDLLLDFRFNKLIKQDNKRAIPLVCGYGKIVWAEAGKECKRTQKYCPYRIPDFYQVADQNHLRHSAFSMDELNSWLEELRRHNEDFYWVLFANDMLELEAEVIISDFEIKRENTYKTRLHRARKFIRSKFQEKMKSERMYQSYFK